MVFADSALQNRGSSPRMNRNMIVFLAADAKRAEELDEAVREFLAWQSIAATEERIKELDLTAQQAAQAEKRLKDADETVNLRIATTYQWLLVPVQPQVDQPVTLDEIKSRRRKGPSGRTGQRQAPPRRPAAHRAGRTEHPTSTSTSTCPPSGNAATSGSASSGSTTASTRTSPGCSERSVLDRGNPRRVFDRADLGCRGIRRRRGLRRRCRAVYRAGHPSPGHVPPQITDSTLLVSPDRAIAQRQQELAERRGRPGGRGWRSERASPLVQAWIARPATGRGSGGQFLGPNIRRGRSGWQAPVAHPKARLRRHPRTPASTASPGSTPNATAVTSTGCHQEIIQHLAAPEGVELEISVEITARKKDGYPDDKVRIVTENARTLKFESYGFEDR